MNLADRPENVADDRDCYGQHVLEAEQANREQTSDRRVSHRPRPSDLERDRYRVRVRAEYADLERRLFG